MDAIGGRKFILAIICLLAGIAMQIWGGGVTPSVTTLILGILGVFSGANSLITTKTLNSTPVVTSVGSNMNLDDIINEKLSGQQSQVEQKRLAGYVQSAVTTTTEIKPVEQDSLAKQVAALQEVQTQIAQSVANTNKLLQAALTVGK